MRINEITIGEICKQIREEEEYLNEDDKKHIEALKKAAIEYVKSYTGLSEEEINEHDDITIAVLVLISDLYDNRQMQVEKNYANQVVETILGMHCINLL